MGCSYEKGRIFPLLDSPCCPQSFFLPPEEIHSTSWEISLLKFLCKCLDQGNRPRGPVKALTEFVIEKGNAAPLFLKSSYSFIHSQSKIDDVFPVFACEFDHFEKKKIRGMGHIMFF